MFEYSQIWIDESYVASDDNTSDPEAIYDDIEAAVVGVANKQAKEGWELVSICPTVDFPETRTAFFKRRKE